MKKFCIALLVCIGLSVNPINSGAFKGYALTVLGGYILWKIKDFKDFMIVHENLLREHSKKTLDVINENIEVSDAENRRHLIINDFASAKALELLGHMELAEEHFIKAWDTVRRDEIDPTEIPFGLQSAVFCQSEATVSS